jgi:hypothetical protein
MSQSHFGLHEIFHLGGHPRRVHLMRVGLFVLAGWSPPFRRWRIPGIRLPAAAIWTASLLPATSWWKRFPGGSMSRLATCSGLSKCSQAKTFIAMCVLDTAAITARFARSSSQTCSGAAQAHRLVRYPPRLSVIADMPSRRPSAREPTYAVAANSL